MVIYGEVGDILVTVETAFSSFDTKFSDYEASEKVELNFSTDLFTLEDKLVTQEDSTSGTAKYDSGLKVFSQLHRRGLTTLASLK